jgi:Polysaccharide lyase family 4, domain II
MSMETPDDNQPLARWRGTLSITKDVVGVVAAVAAFLVALNTLGLIHRRGESGSRASGVTPDSVAPTSPVSAPSSGVDSAVAVSQKATYALVWGTSTLVAGDEQPDCPVDAGTGSIKSIGDGGGDRPLIANVLITEPVAIGGRAVYQARTDPRGFCAPHVNPGTYTLGVFADDLAESYTLSGVSVAAGHVTRVGFVLTRR